MRIGDLMAYPEAVRTGLGAGFLADCVACVDDNLEPMPPTLKIKPTGYRHAPEPEDT